MSQDFWSRRREAVAAETEANERAAAQQEEFKSQEDLEVLSDEEVLAKFGLPDPDTLDSSDAVKDFLSHGLPQRLKTRALRRLWRLNPVLANLDGLIDYGQDFTDAATVVENLQTTYQVGKGMLAHIEEMARKAAEAEASKTEDELEPEDAEDDLLAEAETAPLTPFVAIDAETPSAETDHTAEVIEDSPYPVARRRMQFQFESNT